MTICKIGEQCVIDPNAAEEQCSVGAIVVAVANGKFAGITQTGSGSLHPSTLTESLKLGKEIAMQLDDVLLDILDGIRKRQDASGFLK